MKEKQTFFDNFIYKLQAFGLLILEKFFLAIGIKTSSFIGGFLLTIFGSFTPPTITAMKNIKSVMPELTFFQRLKIVFGMWNNLGRDLGEFVNFNCKNFNKSKNHINHAWSVLNWCHKIIDNIINLPCKVAKCKNNS